MRDGYTDVPGGKLANVVTYLEMRKPPAQATPTMPRQPHPAMPSRPSPTMSDFPIGGAERREFAIGRVQQPDLEWYRRLFREIGEPWLWFSRLRMPDSELRAILHDPAVDVFALAYEGRDHGLLEFDRRNFPDIEVAFFGVTSALIGKGAGRALLAYGLALEWEHHPQRIFLHTCTADHPAALPFYRKFGFVAYKRAIEIADDPRLTGEMPPSAAPHIPIIGRAKEASEPAG